MIALDNAIHGWAPRALPHACGAPFRHLMNDVAAWSTGKRPTLDRSKPATGHLLKFGQRQPEARKIRVGDRWKKPHEHEVSDATDILFRRWREPRERRFFSGPVETRLSGRHHQNTTPRFRERQANEQRSDI